MQTRSLRDYRLSEFMTPGPLTVSPEARVRDAVLLMGRHGIGSLVLMKNGEPQGVFTERDLLGAMVRPESAMRSNVEELASSGFAEVDASASSREAAKRMMEAKGRLLVFDVGRLAGIVTATDVVKVIWRLGVDFEIGNVISKEVVTMRVHSRIQDVVEEMDRRRVGSILLTERRRLCGIFTERDLLNRLLILNEMLRPRGEQALRKSMREPARLAATSTLVSAEFGIMGAQAAAAMVSRHIKRLPLMRKGKLAGIVTARDLVEAYAYPGWSRGSAWLDQTTARYGEVCPICNSRIDEKGLCACGAGGA